jgi:hypothetical protein
MAVPPVLTDFLTPRTLPTGADEAGGPPLKVLRGSGQPLWAGVAARGRRSAAWMVAKPSPDEATRRRPRQARWRLFKVSQPTREDDVRLSRAFSRCRVWTGTRSSSSRTGWWSEWRSGAGGCSARCARSRLRTAITRSRSPRLGGTWTSASDGWSSAPAAAGVLRGRRPD